jgi:hypothetical protein
MPQFEMDKDGTVNGLTFEDCTPIFQGYIEAMLFTETCSGISMVEWEEPENQEAVEEGSADGSIPTDAGFGDIHPKTLETMQLDCFNFEVKARPLLEQAYALGYEPVQAGRDFWFTRNGHGVGFWDRDILEKRDVWEELGSPRVGEPGWDQYMEAREDSLGRKLTEVAKEFGETWSDFVPDPDSPTGYGYVHLT